MLPLCLSVCLPVCVDSDFMVLFFCQFYFTNILIITHLNVDKVYKLVYNVITEWGKAKRFYFIKYLFNNFKGFKIMKSLSIIFGAISLAALCAVYAAPYDVAIISLYVFGAAVCALNLTIRRV